MGFFEFLVDRSEDYFSGTYYANKPKTTQDVGLTFHYDIEQEPTQTKINVINNLQAEEENYAIKTVDNVSFKLNGYIVTQDEDLWQIVSMLKRPYKAEKEAYRLFRTVPKTETVLRLLKIPNPWRLK